MLSYRRTARTLEGDARKEEGWSFSGVGGCNIYIKNQLKSEILYNKNSLHEILTQNLVTFQR